MCWYPDQRVLCSLFYCAVAYVRSDLYQLESSDYRGRPPLDGAQPVTCVANTEQNLYRNKWVAEVVLAREVGKEVLAYRDKRTDVTELKRSRAKAKMYSAGTSLLRGEGQNLKLSQKVSRHKLHLLSELTSSVHQIAGVDAAWCTVKRS